MNNPLEKMMTFSTLTSNIDSISNAINTMNLGKLDNKGNNVQNTQNNSNNIQNKNKILQNTQNTQYDRLNMRRNVGQMPNHQQQNMNKNINQMSNRVQNINQMPNRVQNMNKNINQMSGRVQNMNGLSNRNGRMGMNNMNNMNMNMNRNQMPNRAQNMNNNTLNMNRNLSMSQMPNRVQNMNMTNNNLSLNRNIGISRMPNQQNMNMNMNRMNDNRGMNIQSYGAMNNGQRQESLITNLAQLANNYSQYSGNNTNVYKNQNTQNRFTNNNQQNMYANLNGQKQNFGYNRNNRSNNSMNVYHGKRSHQQTDMQPQRYKSDKKFKYNPDVNPSRVLHVRGLSKNVTEYELCSIAAKFGRVERILILLSQMQAFIQLDSIHTAEKLIQYHRQRPAFIDNRPVYFEYSVRNEIKHKKYEYNAEEKTNKVLLVSVHKVKSQISTDQLYRAFSPFGEVLKIIIFSRDRDTAYKAFVEFRLEEHAANAKQSLHQREMYSGHCQFNVTYSKLRSLKIQGKSGNSRDYTLRPYVERYNDNQFGNNFNGYGNNRKQNYGNNNYGNGNNFGYGGNNNFGNGKNYGNSYGSTNDQYGNKMSTNTVLLVSNLDEEKITPDILFTLFGVYGDVLRVKIIYKKQDSALVQLTNSNQASLAYSHLNGCSLFGKKMNIKPSKHTEITSHDVRSSQGKQMTKDYTNSKLHRFKMPFSKNYKNIWAPSEVLHFSNLPEYTEEELYNVLSEEGLKVAGILFFEKDRKMAFVRMENKEDAIQILVKFHNREIKNRNVKISFSNNSPDKVPLYTPKKKFEPKQAKKETPVKEEVQKVKEEEPEDTTNDDDDASLFVNALDAMRTIASNGKKAAKVELVEDSTTEDDAKEVKTETQQQENVKTEIQQ